MKHIKTSTWRTLCFIAVFVLVAVGLLTNTGLGTLSSFGYKYITLICPLGAIESFLSGKAIIFRALMALLVVIVIVLLVGKAFCGWVCPVPHLQRFFSTKKQRARDLEIREAAGEEALANFKSDTKVARHKVNLDMRHGVLGISLLSALLFGFPVFCLICPVGLTFATFIAIWNLIGHNDLTFSLLLFPTILLIELLFLRKWCFKFCPIGALLSLISVFNKSFTPKVDTARCQRYSKKIDCASCSKSCPELIDPHSDKGLRPLHECTKCLKCVDACPNKAITLKFK